MENLLSLYAQTARGLGNQQNALFGYTGIDEYPGPQLPVGANDFMVVPQKAQQTLSPGRDRVLPSHEFWDRYVSTSPAVHDQIGRVQSAGLSAINSLGFGLPMAAAHRFAPEQAQRVQAVIDAYPNEKAVAGIGAAVVNPANIGLRAAGNALAARGYGVASQAAADGVTAAGAYALPHLVKDGGLPPMAGDIPATTAMTARVLMPTLPPSLIEQTARGVQAGVFGQVPEAVMQQNPQRALMGGMYGAMYGAGLKPGGSDAIRDKAAEALLRERYISNLLGGASVVGGLTASGYLNDLFGKSDQPSPPIGDPQYPHFAPQAAQPSASFDSGITEILRKYGLLPPAVAGAVAASGQDQAQARQ